jgi:hypothetical protein
LSTPHAWLRQPTLLYQRSTCTCTYAVGDVTMVPVTAPMNARSTTFWGLDPPEITLVGDQANWGATLEVKGRSVYPALVSSISGGGGTAALETYSRLTEPPCTPQALTFLTRTLFQGKVLLVPGAVMTTLARVLSWVNANLARSGPSSVNLVDVATGTLTVPVIIIEYLGLNATSGMFIGVAAMAARLAFPFLPLAIFHIRCYAAHH